MGLPRGEQEGHLTLSSSVCVFKENLLDPNTDVDARDCWNKNGRIERTARWRRALKPQEDDDDDEADGEKRQIWVVPRGCQS